MREIEAATIAGLEAEVWEALVAGDARADEHLLADDFLGEYPTGFAGRSDHVEQLAEGPTVAEYRLSDEPRSIISDDAVLDSDRADDRRPSPDDSAQWETMFVSSLRCRRDGRWVDTFSQDRAASRQRGD